MDAPTLSRTGRQRIDSPTNEAFHRRMDELEKQIEASTSCVNEAKGAISTLQALIAANVNDIASLKAAKAEGRKGGIQGAGLAATIAGVLWYLWEAYAASKGVK